MIKIKSIKCSIDVVGKIEQYGFNYTFNDGLNIICGDNSSGKSTILSCIYYCLGMEQLLGGNKSDILDMCLRRSFEINKIQHQVSHSQAILVIENTEGSVATIKRKIKSNNENCNSLVVKELIDNVEKTQTLYVHSIGDHIHNDGFFNWLKEFMAIPLPEIKEDGGKVVKSLYLQNVLSCALIEQTKGWSDFFAQMPYFGIRDVKTKVIEYLLNLESLENDIKKDLFKNKRELLKKEWTENYENFTNKISHFSILLDGFTEKHTKVDNNLIRKSELYCSNEGELVPLTIHINNLKVELQKQEEINKKSTKANTEEQKVLLISIKNLNEQIKTLVNKKINEGYKLQEYEVLIQRNTEEIERVSGIRNVKVLNDRTKITACPVCDSELKEEARLALKPEQIDFDKSLAFLRSQKDLYTGYVKNLKPLLEKLEHTAQYYTEKLDQQKLTLRELNKDINEEIEISRANITKEIILNINIKQNQDCLDLFTKFIDSMVNLNTEIELIDGELEDLKQGFQNDLGKIKNFEQKFKALLDDFDYSSNDLKNVKIKVDYPSKLLPFIEIKNIDRRPDKQPIRLSSSASDFIRSEWAFYLALSKSSNIHPGFIVFDEPGQHAMKSSSMKSLILKTSVLKQQTILAISKNTKEKGEEKNNIEQLLEGIEPKSIKVMDIDPFNTKKCISVLT